MSAFIMLSLCRLSRISLREVKCLDISFLSSEIIERIKFSYNGVPFRPHLSQLGQTHKFITDLIKECWDEDPFKRPDFKVIRSKLKPMQKGM